MALILNVSRVIDDAELQRLSRLNPGHQLERDAQGRLVVTPTGWRSGGRNMQLAKQLLDWHALAKAGKLFDSSTGFHLADGSVRSPDASWVSCKLGVLIDPQARSVELYRPNAPAERHDYGPLSLAELPGFILDPGKLD